MKKTVAIPARLLKPEDQLSPEEKLELANFGDQPLTDDDLAEIEVREANDAKEKADRAKVKYREDRAREYPPIGDQLDAVMKWLATESEFTVPAELKSLAMQCMSVKAKHPKPVEDEA
jgi:hypothetical protein